MNNENKGKDFCNGFGLSWKYLSRTNIKMISYRYLFFKLIWNCVTFMNQYFETKLKCPLLMCVVVKDFHRHCYNFYVCRNAICRLYRSHILIWVIDIQFYWFLCCSKFKQVWMATNYTNAIQSSEKPLISIN